MVRNLFGSLLALVGAAAAAWSPFRVWYAGRLGRDFRLHDLFTASGITSASASLWTSLFLPMLVAGGLTFIAVLLRSRAVVVLAALLVLGFATLWMVRQGQAAGTLTAGGNGLAEGVAAAVGGGVLLLLGALVMRGRGYARTRRRGGAHARGTEPGAYEDYGRPDEFGPQPYEEPYEEPYGPPGPHGAYQADERYGPPYGPEPNDGSTPAQEWDPWNRSRPGSPQPPPPPPQGADDTRRMRPPGHGPAGGPGTPY